MVRLRRIVAAVLVSLAALAAIAKVLLIDPPPLPVDSTYKLEVERVRALATQVPGALPLRVNRAVVAEQTKPRLFADGRLSFEPYVMVWTAFQVVYSDRRIVIDAPPDRDVHRQRAPADAFFPEQFESVQRALREATAILVTHEHPDHIGGIARAPAFEQLRVRLLLTREQLTNATALERAGFPAGAIRALEPLAYEHYHALAPGLVLIKAPGHTPGSQMIYVRCADGLEVLLAGDIGWHADHVDIPRGRPRLSSWFIGEDSDAIGHQLRRLHDVARQEGIQIVIAHDGERLALQVASGTLGAAFE